MKAFYNIAIYAFSAIILFGCEEKNDLIYIREGNQIYLDSSYTAAAETPQDRNVLIEDFTGVRCVNCPKAQKEAEAISELYPGRIVINAVHVTDFARPYGGSKYDFRTIDGNNLTTLMGDPGPLPQGSVDRKISAVSGTVFSLYPQWRALVATEINEQTPVNVSFVKKNFDESTRTLEVNIKVSVNKEINEPLYLSANIVESGMIDVQETPDGKDSNYVHKHVLRAYVPPFNGFYLGDKHAAGKVYILGFNIKISDKWMAENCHINAKVHYRETGKLNVLQVQETELK